MCEIIVDVPLICDVERRLRGGSRRVAQRWRVTEDPKKVNIDVDSVIHLKSRRGSNAILSKHLPKLTFESRMSSLTRDSLFDLTEAAVLMTIMSRLLSSLVFLACINDHQRETLEAVSITTSIAGQINTQEEMKDSDSQASIQWYRYQRGYQ